MTLSQSGLSKPQNGLDHAHGELLEQVRDARDRAADRHEKLYAGAGTPRL